MAVRKPYGEAIAPTFKVGAPIPEHPSDLVRLGQKPLTPSPQLAQIVGSGQLSRGEVVSKIWDYIKKNRLQDPANRRKIVADAKLKPILGGKDKVSMFEMNKHLAQHLR